MISLKVSPDGESPYVVKAQARDVLVWERSGRDRSFGALMTNLRMGDLYELAYLAARRQGLTALPDRAAFEGVCDVEPHADAEDTEPDPTRKAP